MGRSRYRIGPRPGCPVWNSRASPRMAIDAQRIGARARVGRSLGLRRLLASPIGVQCRRNHRRILCLYRDRHRHTRHHRRHNHFYCHHQLGCSLSKLPPVAPQMPCAPSFRAFAEGWDTSNLNQPVQRERRWVRVSHQPRSEDQRPSFLPQPTGKRCTTPDRRKPQNQASHGVADGQQQRTITKVGERLPLIR